MIADQTFTYSPLAQTECPDDAQLKSYLIGTLGSDGFADTTMHIDQCESCQRRVDSIPQTDPWVKRFGGSFNREFLDESDLSAAIVSCVSTSPTPLESTLPLPPTETIGAYQLIRPLGRGGMGTVYLAKHQTLDRLCAMKLLPLRGDVERFDREARSLAAIDHPGVVPATDAGTHDRWRYLVMQYVEGVDLADALAASGPMAVGVACRIGADIASAIAAIHRAGLIHRDIKPANVMLTRNGDVKVLDFGLAATATVNTPDDRLTTVGDLVGTVAYAAPEQLSGDQPVAAADWYAFGATLFRMLTGTTTHPGASRRGLTSLMMAKAQSKWESSTPLDALPNAVGQLVGDLLSLRPGDRPSDPDRIIETLQQYADPTHDGVAGIADATPQRPATNDSAHHPTIEPSPAWAVNADHQPPSRGRFWTVAAGGFMGGALTLAASGWLIELSSKKGSVSLETDQADAKVRIVERSRQRDAVANLAGNSAPLIIGGIDLSNIDRTKLDSVYNGRTVEDHLRQLSIELNPDRLAESIKAISQIATAEDAELVQATFLPARRLGGWVAGSNTPSGQFMQATGAVYKTLPSSAIVAAAIREFEDGTENSIAMIGMNFLSGSQLWQDEVPTDQVDRLIDRIIAYQADHPAVKPPRDYQTLPTKQINIYRLREQLIQWASFDRLDAGKITGAKTWLPETWNNTARYRWPMDTERLATIEHMITENLEHSDGSISIKSCLGEPEQTKRSERVQQHHLRVARDLGIDIPIPVRWSVLMLPNQRMTSQRIQPWIDFDSMNRDQKQRFADAWVLEGLPLVACLSPTNEEFATVAFSPSATEEFGGHFGHSTPGWTANAFFATSIVWIDRLSELRSLTRLPNTFDRLVQRLEAVASNIERYPNIAADISDTSKASSGNGLSPTRDDLKKLKAIQTKLQSYLNR